MTPIGSQQSFANRTARSAFARNLCRARNPVERSSNKRRRVAKRRDKLVANYPAFIQFASIRLWLHVRKSTL